MIHGIRPNSQLNRIEIFQSPFRQKQHVVDVWRRLGNLLEPGKNRGQESALEAIAIQMGYDTSTFSSNSPHSPDL